LEKTGEKETPLKQGKVGNGRKKKVNMGITESGKGSVCRPIEGWVKKGGRTVKNPGTGRQRWTKER